MNRFKKTLIALLTPFGLVLILTLAVFFFAFFLGDQKGSFFEKLISTVSFWYDGVFGLLGFTMQMMMVLSLGYALATFAPINRFLVKVSLLPDSLVQGALLISGLTMICGLFNWGFGLVIGAVFSRLVHHSMVQRSIPSNAGLLAAGGYLGMAVWHGGLSGSAPLSVADSNHFLVDKLGVIPVNETVFSNFNLFITGGLFLVFLGLTGLLATVVGKNLEEFKGHEFRPIEKGDEDSLGRIAGIGMIAILILITVFSDTGILQRFSLNWVIFLLLGLVLMSFRSTERFTKSLQKGLSASADIFFQFPFYAGILGLLSGSGLIREFSIYIQGQSSAESFPLVSFIASAFTNLLVPSGGGQWAIQGELFMTAAQVWGLDLGKMVMVFSYGDQITNLLQPFWALPLLSITGVPIRKIFPYTILYFFAGFSFLLGMIWFLI